MWLIGCHLGACTLNQMGISKSSLPLKAAHQSLKVGTGNVVCKDTIRVCLLNAAAGFK